MDVFGGPIVLGSIMASLLPVAWMLGRRQGAQAASEPRGEAVAARISGAETPAAARRGTIAARLEQNWSVDQPSRLDKRAQLGAGASLEELHADISAYRRAQQILSQTATAELTFGCSAYGRREIYRALGIGNPATRLPAQAEHRPCRCGTCNGLSTRQPLAQPSCELSLAMRL